VVFKEIVTDDIHRGRAVHPAICLPRESGGCGDEHRVRGRHRGDRGGHPGVLALTADRKSTGKSTLPGPTGPGRGAQTVSGLVGIGHNLSRLWFVRADAGYGGMTQSPSSLKIPFLGSVVGGAAWEPASRTAVW